jgi:glucose/arabinose dehydrogenase
MGRRPLRLMAVTTLAAVVAACSSATEEDESAATSPTSSPTSSSGTTAGTSTPESGEIVASGLDVPWDVAPLDDGSALVTLRDRAHVLRVRPGSDRVDLGAVDGVQADGEGGLLGVAVDPDDPDTVLLYTTTADDNRVLRGRLTDTSVTDLVPVVTGIPRAGFHNGGRITFGPDGYLYVTTGDAGNGANAQDPGSLGGKILRITVDGAPAPDNPDPDSPVWSLGHRNVQGLAWTADGTMYATEFGQNTWDELNIITPGSNYGWPVVEGIANDPAYVDPVLQWATDEASPSGLAATTGGHLWMAALRGESVWHIRTSRGEVVGDPERLLDGTYGRIRHVAAMPDGTLWVLTSNTFRGDPREGDDRILVFDPDDLASR